LAKHYLNTPADDLDFLLFGIVSGDSQYRVVSLLNGGLGIDLTLSEFVQLTVKPRKMFSFSLFHYQDEELSLEYYFIPNISNSDDLSARPQAADLFSEVNVEERARLIKELPKTDYFLIVRGERATTYGQRIMETLKQVEGLGRVQSIEPAELASSRNLIF
jgi:hypothetical protein